MISGKWLALIDPHEKYFQNEEGKATGERYRLADMRSQLEHQFEPYQGIFNCSEETFKKGNFQGTLFRFPLRQAKSPLSDNCYSSQKVLQMFASFEREAHLMLLFLKHVECIELCVRKQGSPTVETLFKVQIQSNTRDSARKVRQDFLQKISTTWSNNPEQISYPLRLETVKYGSVEEKSAFSYVISEYLGGGEEFSTGLRDMCSGQTCQNIPLVGSAFLIGISHTGSSVDKTEVQKKKQKKKSQLQRMQGVKSKDGTSFEADGHVFCTLPLPTEQKSSSGLPVHINGRFSVSQDRRHLKWAEHAADKDVLWNQCLLNELIPKAYVNLVLQMVQWCMENTNGVSPEHILQVLPDIQQVEVLKIWLDVVEPFYEQLLKYKVFHSKNGHWLLASECVLECLNDSDQARNAVEKVLLSLGVNVVRLPVHVILPIKCYQMEDVQTITPSLARRLICQEVNANNKSKISALSSEEKKELRKFLAQTEEKCLPPDQLKVLSALPLFETIPFGKDMKTKFVAVDELSLAAPQSLPVKQVNSPLLDLQDHSSQGLARLLHVKTLSHTEFLTDVMFPELQVSPNQEKLEITLDFVMRNFQRLQEEKGDFVEQLQKLPFVRNENGKYVTVTEVFDPEDPFLKRLFWGENMFPQGKFVKGKPLIFLRQIGLRKRCDIQTSDIVTSVCKLQALLDSKIDNPNLIEKSDTLVKHLHDNKSLLETFHKGKKLKHWLSNYVWMACLRKRPDVLPDSLDLYQGLQFLKPGSLLPQELVPLIGCVAPVCGSPYAGLVLKALGISVLPSVKQVLQQIRLFTEAYYPNEKAKFLHLLKVAYTFLERADTSEVLKIAKEIDLRDWVWNGEGFSSINKVVACKLPQDTQPYLFPLPLELQSFRFMFERFGMQSKCDTRTWVKVLQDIKCHSSQVQDQAHQLQLAINILNILKNKAHEVDDSLREILLIPVKVSTGLLKFVICLKGGLQLSLSV